jgi:NADH-quinone oxidoreductase B subunit
MSVLTRLSNWSRVKSPWVLHFNAGGCNGCDIEILAALMPRFDAERFGVLLKATPRHTDVILCTGCVTKQIASRLKRVYEQTPDPKFVIAVGSCATGGAPFNGCYCSSGGIDKVIPVDMYIPGCPPRPDAFIYGVAQLLAKLQGKK